MKAESFRFGGWLFLRLLAIVHLVAFASYWAQAAGLVGPNGILPASRLFAVVHQQLGGAAFWQLPSLCWWLGAGPAIPGMCAAGAGLALLLFAGIAPAACLTLLWVDYLSLACAGQIFFDFQWDALLLETTLLSIFFAPWSLRAGWTRPEPPPLGRWLLVWLLFRLMLLSGLVKLASGDPTWWHLSALSFHYETQPLPTSLAWYAHQLPAWFQRACCAIMFVVELGAPWALFAPRRWRHPAALALIGLQIMIAATGNYTFFNLLTISLCLLCLDDAWWGRLANTLPGPPEAPLPRRAPAPLLRGFAVFVVVCTGAEALADFLPAVAESRALGAMVGVVAPFRSLNNYGLFARMTTRRPELIIQGSRDGLDWRTYELPDKPGNPGRRPNFVAPFQPRLDWQLWFAALESPEENRWVTRLCVDLLRGSPPVLSLFAFNPFPGTPPQFVRVVRYDYRFTNWEERRRTGNWWKREVLDFYVPAFSL